jgi:hypothetical protein
VNRYSNPDKKKCRHISCCESPDYCIDSQQLMFLHYFLSGLLYRFTTTYVSTLLFIRITVSIHNNLCFYITFYQDYCIDSQQFMFLHYFLSGLLYRFTTIDVSTFLFIRITVSIHNNWCFYITVIPIKSNVETLIVVNRYSNADKK